MSHIRDQLQQRNMRNRVGKFKSSSKCTWTSNVICRLSKFSHKLLYSPFKQYIHLFFFVKTLGVETLRSPFYWCVLSNRISIHTYHTGKTQLHYSSVVRKNSAACYSYTIRRIWICSSHFTACCQTPPRYFSLALKKLMKKF